MIGARPILSSSMSRTFGRWIRARAMASICCSPPDSDPAQFPARLEARKNRASTADPGHAVEATRRFSSTVSVVNSCSCREGTMPARTTRSLVPSSSRRHRSRPIPHELRVDRNRQEERLPGAVGAKDACRSGVNRGGRRPEHGERTGRLQDRGTSRGFEPATVSCIVPAAARPDQRIVAGSPSRISSPKSST